jgi:cytochrome c biogenesis protein CcdA
VLKLAITIVAIALPDCINPSLIGGELYVATGPHPRRRVIAFTLAAFAVTFVVGVALALGLGDLILSVVPQPSDTLTYALATAAGVVLVLGGAVILVRRHALVAGERRVPHGSAALIGGGIAGIELLSAFPYFAAIAIIVGADVPNAGKLGLIALYCVVYCLPLIAIAVMFAVLGERAETVLEPVGGWLEAHWPLIVGPLTVALGVGVLAFGIIQLATA